jgi:SAM-dependent methyltransferase
LPRKRRPVALDAYEELADRYASLTDEKAENAFYERPAVLSLLPHVGGKRVLDAGCGPGFYTQWLLEHGADVVGIDVSPRMIWHAKKRVGKRAEFHVADLGTPLDFLESKSFDLVLASLVLSYIEDLAPVFAEFNRLLKGFGLLVFSCAHPLGYLERNPGADYFATEYVEDVWRGFGEPMVVPCYRRPLWPLISGLIESGFAIEAFLEPQAGEDVRKRDEAAYRRLRRRPGIIAVRARKASG